MPNGKLAAERDKLANDKLANDKLAADEIRDAYKEAGNTVLESLSLPDRCVGKNWLKGYLEYTQDTEAPDIYHLWCGISAIAGAMKRNCWMDMGPMKPLYPNLYVVITGPSAEVKKSSALDVIEQLINKLPYIHITRDKMSPEGLVTKLASQIDPELLAKQGIAKKDGTIYVMQDELATMLGGISYTQGLTDLLVSLYNCRDSYDVLLKHSPQNVQNTQMNLLAASTPEWLALGMPDVHQSGGFIGRFIFVVAYEPKKKVAFPKLTTKMIKLKELLDADLLTISKLKGEFTWTPETIELYIPWYNTYKAGEDPRLAEYQGRKPSTVKKLSMIISASSSNSMVVESQHLRASWTILDRVEHNMADAFMYLGSTEEHKLARVVLSILSASSPTKNDPPVSRTALVRSVAHRVRRIADFNEVMEMLSQEGRVRKIVKSTQSYYKLTTEEEMKAVEQEKKRKASVLEGVFDLG